MSATVRHVRFARPTDRLEDVARFYVDVLGFERLGSFRDHEGFDGVMLGEPSGAFHLELTHAHGEPTSWHPDREALLVLYYDHASFVAMKQRVEESGVVPVASANPYWDRHGITIEDPDGARIVLHDGEWRAAPRAEKQL